MKETETVTPSGIYQKVRDKQRVVITGTQAKMITAMVVFVLESYGKKFDLVRSTPPTFRLGGDGAFVIIESQDKTDASLLDYHHHIGVVSEAPTGTESVLGQFADATPKGGALIFTETEPVGAIGRKERPGINIIPYKAYPHVMENGSVLLLSGKNARMPVRLRGEQNLRNACAAEEILKKVAITSSQFYQAMARFDA